MQFRSQLFSSKYQSSSTKTPLGLKRTRFSSVPYLFWTFSVAYLLYLSTCYQLHFIKYQLTLPLASYKLIPNLTSSFVSTFITATTATSSAGVTHFTSVSNPIPQHGRVGWNRSWPLYPADDDTKLLALEQTLQFKQNTLLNYFHLHKTGGVSIKSSLMTLFTREENQNQVGVNGERLNVATTCYHFYNFKKNRSQFRCDLKRIGNLSRTEKEKIDIILGHQYWENGVNEYFSRFRDVRMFSIFRHPLPRRLSFYFHFHVRNKRKEASQITSTEIINYLLDRPATNASTLKQITKNRLKDEGPNYYAARFLSDSQQGFVGRRFHINAEKKDGIIETVKRRIEERFVFVGLQLQPRATQCMLKKTMQVFAHAHGIDTLVGTTQIDRTPKRLNLGHYNWTGRSIWDKMNRADKDLYKTVESIDLVIYDFVVEKFKIDVKLFGCQHLVDYNIWQTDSYL